MLNYKVAKDLTKEFKTKHLGQNVTSMYSRTINDQIVHDELVELMGTTQEGINLSDNQPLF